MRRLPERHIRTLLILICVLAVHQPSEAQDLRKIFSDEGTSLRLSSMADRRFMIPDRSSRDRRLLFDIYGVQNSLFTATMAAADYTAYPVMYGAVPAIWVGSVVSGSGDDRRSALQLTVAWSLATGSSVVLKHLIKRPRPFEVETGIEARTRYIGARHIDRYSFPSGHAAITAAIATSLSLSYPHWYVIVPGYVIASSVSLSRIWLGVHYPSDVVSGFLIGVAAGSLAHWAGDRLFD